MSSVVNSAEFLHKQLENMCSHKEVTRDTPPFYAENFLLCRKFSVMQKISYYAEKFPVCRKIMQKVFLYAEKISFYAEKMSFKHEPFTKTMSIVD